MYRPLMGYGATDTDVMALQKTGGSSPLTAVLLFGVLIAGLIWISKHG